MTQRLVKAKAAVLAGDTTDESPYGTFEVILSTAATDRDGDELRPEQWKSLPAHIPFDIDHGMTVATTVGSGVPSINDAGQLVVAGTWASTELAQTTRTLVKEGHIRATSVAYLEQESDGAVTRELLNGAFVAIPANPEALVLSAKSLDVDSGVEPAVQAAQDKALDDAVRKAVEGSLEQREQAVWEALDQAFGDDEDVWAWPVATFDDSVVLRLSAPDDRRGTYQAEYSIDETGLVTLADTMTPVTITEVVTQAGDPVALPPTDVEQDSGTAPSDPPAGDKSLAGGDDGAVPDDQLAAPAQVKEQTEARVHALDRLFA